MDDTIYYVLGAVLLVYLFISFSTKRKAKDRKARKFMEGHGSSKRKNNDEKKVEN